MKTAYIIVNIYNGYKNIANNNVYTDLKQAETDKKTLENAWDARGSYYVVPMNLL